MGKKDVCHETHVLMFLMKLNMIRNVFCFLKGGVCLNISCGFYIQMWLCWWKYNQFKKKKWEEGRYKRLELELNLYVVPDTRYKVSGEESKWQVNC